MKYLIAFIWGVVETLLIIRMGFMPVDWEGSLIPFLLVPLIVGTLGLVVLVVNYIVDNWEDK